MSNQKYHRSIRDAFGQFATGITIVTTIDQNAKPVGLTANSFASVSLEPPLVSWCVDRSSKRFNEFAEAEFFTISVLTDQQQDVSDLFATRSWDETAFDEIDWYKGHHDIPQIKHASARFHCKTQHLYEGGDHLIIVGLVEDYDSEPASPLLFSQGEYRTLS